MQHLPPSLIAAASPDEAGLDKLAIWLVILSLGVAVSVAVAVMRRSRATIRNQLRLHLRALGLETTRGERGGWSADGTVAGMPVQVTLMREEPCGDTRGKVAVTRLQVGYELIPRMIQIEPGKATDAPTGDADFDARARIVGGALTARAYLSAPRRAAIGKAMTDLEARVGEGALWLDRNVRPGFEGVFVQSLRDLVELANLLPLFDGDVPGALRHLTERDPSEGVRQRCAMALSQNHNDPPTLVLWKAVPELRDAPVA